MLSTFKDAIYCCPVRRPKGGHSDEHDGWCFISGNICPSVETFSSMKSSTKRSNIAMIMIMLRSLDDNVVKDDKTNGDRVIPDVPLR